MKKLTIVALVLIGFISISNAQSIKFGVKGGINFSSLNGDDDQIIEGRTGFHIGVVGEFGLADKLFLQPEIMYSSQGADPDIGGFLEDIPGLFDDDADFGIDYLNVPILIKYKFLKLLDVHAGPQFGIKVSEGDDLDDVESFDLSGAVGAGVHFGKFFGQLRYNFGLTDVFPDVDLKNNNFQISVGYYIF